MIYILLLSLMFFFFFFFFFFFWYEQEISHPDQEIYDFIDRPCIAFRFIDGYYSFFFMLVKIGSEVHLTCFPNNKTIAHV